MFTQAVVAVEAKTGRSLQEEFQDNLVSENKEQTNKNPSVLRGLYNVLSYTYIVCLFFMCKCFIYNFVVVKSCLACSLNFSFMLYFMYMGILPSCTSVQCGKLRQKDYKFRASVDNLVRDPGSK